MEDEDGGKKRSKGQQLKAMARAVSEIRMAAE